MHPTDRPHATTRAGLRLRRVRQRHHPRHLRRLPPSPHGPGRLDAVAQAGFVALTGLAAVMAYRLHRAWREAAAQTAGQLAPARGYAMETDPFARNLILTAGPRIGTAHDGPGSWARRRRTCSASGSFMPSRSACR